MNADQLKGKWTQFKGELKQKWGKFTDDDLQADRRQLRQVYRQSPGTVWLDKKSELMKWADAWHQKSARRKP